MTLTSYPLIYRILVNGKLMKPAPETPEELMEYEQGNWTGEIADDNSDAGQT